MRRIAVLAAVVTLVAGCGGSHPAAVPTVALLLRVHVDATSAAFTFRTPPTLVRTRYVPRSQVVESGSGRRVPLRGRASLVVSFSPAATAEAAPTGMMFSYTGPRRLRPATPGGPVLELVKTGDFESQLDWALGLDRRRPVTVKRDGATVIVRFG